MEQKQAVLQTVKRHYSLDVDHCTHRISSSSTRYSETVLSCFSEIGMNVKSEIKAHFFDHSDPVFFMVFHETFGLACSTNRIHEGETMWVLLLFVMNSLAITLNSRMSGATPFALVVTSVDTVDLTTQMKIHCFYLEIATYLLKNFVSNQAISTTDDAILGCTEPANITLMQYAYSLYAKSSKGAGISGEATLNDIFIEGSNSSISDSLRK